MKYTIDVYMDKGNEWRWRLRYRGDVMADSGEGYTTKNDCLRALRGIGWKMMFARVNVRVDL